MKKFSKLFLIIALVAVMVSFAGCVTTTSIGGTSDAHGLFSRAKAAVASGTEIASYSVIMGLFDAGYTGYAASVKTAEAQGKQITTVTKYYYFYYTTKAYAK